MIIDDLKKYGPDASPSHSHSQSDSLSPPSPDEAKRYCRRLAKAHYENFTVANWFLPRVLKQHFYNVYAYCRWADDLADETGDPERSIQLLEWWEDQLNECYAGRATHPVFVALSETIREFAIPAKPFADLLAAFRRDQQAHEYETKETLLDYCRYSANPVGRLVLYLARCHDEDRGRLSDSVCTGLQLVNFWQDVARDWDIGRVYLPLADRRRFGYDDAMLQSHLYNEPFRRLMEAEVADAEERLRAGLPLVGMVPRGFRLQISLFIHGGLAVAEAIRESDYDVWKKRPALSKSKKLGIALRCWLRPERAPAPPSPRNPAAEESP